MLPLLGGAVVGVMHGPSAAQFGWIMLLGLVAVFGPGMISLDHFWYKFLHRWLASRNVRPDREPDRLPRVVIVGGGFGGVAAAHGLAHARCAVTLVDRHNYHLFQPLLYQVATASLSPADIAVPIRGLLRNQNNARVLLGTVTGIDRERRTVLLADGARLPYDYLVLATGAQHSYFGRDAWGRCAPGLKTIEDATEIRRRLLLAFEQAEAADDPALQRDLLTFAIVGGGPTGVELAGAIAELARHGLARDFRRIDPASARVVLVQSGQRILPTFPEPLSAAATTSLRALGVEVLTGGAVEEIDAGSIVVSGERIRCRTTFWCAGVTASPAAGWLGAPSDRAGRVEVAPDLSVPGAPDIFVIGDTAASHAWAGKMVPGLAPAAKQGGAYVAAVIRARLENRPPPAPFRYRHAGSLATIGRKAAVADFGRVRLSGGIAWWLWGAAHILFLAGMRNRVTVAVEWFWAYLTFSSSTRLITGDISDMARTRGDMQRLEPAQEVTSHPMHPERALG
jgi:NADH dehydrogenase/putative oxidoreductase